MGCYYMSEYDVVMEWFGKVADDLQSADVLLGVNLTANSCYHAQQAGEKALKAYLSLHTEEIPRTHILELLCAQCMESDASFSEILQMASDLTEYAVRIRYPNTNNPTKQDAENAIQKASKIFMFVQERIPAQE